MKLFALLQSITPPRRHKCSLASLDACPLRPVAVSGWRIAALWSRDYGPREAESNQEANAQLRGRRASHAVYIRFLQADPRFGQETSKITSRDCGPDMMDRPLLHTMFASHRFCEYQGLLLAISVICYD